MKLKRLVAGLTALAMTASLFTFTAFADTTTVPITSITFNSTLNLNDNAVTAPTVEYTYTLTSGKAETAVTMSTADATNTNPTADIYAGVFATGVESIVETVSFSPSDLASTDADVAKSVTFAIDPTTLGITNSGYYVYKLTQTSTTDDGGSAEDENFINDTETRYLYLEVKVVDGALAVTDTAVYSSTLTTQAGSEIADEAKLDDFVNYYGCDSDGDGKPDDDDDDTDAENNGLTFVVTAYSFGDMADASEDFDYTVKTTAEKDTVYKVTYGSENLTLMVNADGYLYAATLNTDGDAYEVAETATAYVFNLAEASTTGVAKTFTILGLVADVEFTVTVKDNENLGYTAQSRENGKTSWETTATSITSTIGHPDTYKMVADDGTDQGLDFATIKGNELPDEEDDDDIQYSGISLPDTGVILEFAPFALMVLAAGAFISLRAISAAKQRK